MNILDIDLDFFLTDVCNLADMGKRPDDSECDTWSTEDVSRFLENNCGLSASRPVRGVIFETHDTALKYWEGIEKPLSVTHIDAHSDLGIGRPGPGFVLNSVITMPVEKRIDIEKYYSMKKLDEGNYLLFALAFRWIDKLINVRNPMSKPDMPKEFCRDGCIKLVSPLAGIMPSLDYNEPEVMYTVYEDYRAYKAIRGFDFVSMAISPRYAPEKADKLIEAVSRYIT